jgi:Flp pilus assembly protein TadD
VHHAAIKIDQTGSSRTLDEDDPEPGYDGGGARTAAFPDGHFFSWTPGQSPIQLPDDMGWQLEPGSDLVLEMHLTPTGKPEAVQAQVGLFFTDLAPTRRPFVVRLGSQSIDIPAGDSEYQVTDSFLLPVGIEVLAVQPHAHYLARQVRGLARLPDGTVKWLVYIKDWDFRWQDVYRLREPLLLPPGSRLEMSYTYDNSTANPRNPHRPPERVTFGQTTASEMGNLWVQVVTQTAGDRATLERIYQPQSTAGDIAGYQKMIEITPGDPRLHADLGFLYVTAGRFDDATRELQTAVDLTPNSAIAHYALGSVFLTRKRLDEAREQLEIAVALDPELVDAHLNLGVAAHAQGRLDDAIGSYATALRLRPDQSQAHYNLGRAYLSQGHLERAMGEYHLALTLKPDDPDTLISLGSVLASSGRPDEALIYYRQALALDADRPGLRAAINTILDRSQLSGGDRHRH